ncbi:phenylalanine 4-monooxygenase [Legionella sp. W05-934-2]|jgi:phenylalanine-4-hydroxylase|uniref:phenylalanine 4-monooxygenase n=1 Tax=Legionella sp. W05-934-2 TaxID=1198649 RepID=UPI0034620DE1
MEFVSSYVSHQPDIQGYVQYSAEDNFVWKTLYERQIEILPGRACSAFMEGLEALNLSKDAIPQLPEVNKRLEKMTGWRVSPVPALISAEAFFKLLARRHFPAATFIRTMEDLNYIQEPDIFHELFGHCPLLTQTHYAEFVQQYAQFVLDSKPTVWPLLQRLFWFTVEFGLIRENGQLRAYGGGILSSIGETPHCLESDEPMRVLFDPVVAFRTPYRIDQMQPIYFVIENFQQLFDFVQQDIDRLIHRARELGEYPPFFLVDENNPNIHIRAC